MTANTALVPQGQTVSQSSPSSYGSMALAAELTKMLQLVAPISMSAEDRAGWTLAAVDALEDIRADEVQAISAELRRSVTRPAQIVPEISRLVAEKRAKAHRVEQQKSPWAAEMAINREAQFRRAKAKTQAEVEEAWSWERNARIDAGLTVPPIAPPLTRKEIARLPPAMVKMGLACGALAERNGEIVNT